MKTLFAVMLSAVIALAGVPVARAQGRPQVDLVAVSHALDGRTLVISGELKNIGPALPDGLIIDVRGYGPSGDLVTTGTDGIPWRIGPGGVERFAIPLLLDHLLVREYVVVVSRPHAQSPLASARRGVDVSLYRDLLRTAVELTGTVHAGTLVVRANAAGFPISLIEAQANVLLLDPRVDWFQVVTLNVDVSPDRPAAVFLGTPHALLLSLRVVEVRLKAAWSN